MAQEIVSPCIDDRMPAALPAILSKLNIRPKYHHVPAFGNSLGLDHEYGLIERIVTCLGSQRIVIIDHLDCKAYRLKFGAVSREEEREKHLLFLHLRARELHAAHPGLTIELYLLPIVDENSIGGHVLEMIPLPDFEQTHDVVIAG
jgi:hypothetical protein